MSLIAPETLNPSVVDVLARTVLSNAELLRLLDPAKFDAVVRSLQSLATASPLPGDHPAWDDLDRWLETLREQERSEAAS